MSPAFVKGGGPKSWYHVKVCDTKNTHVQYESPTSSGLKVIAKVQVFVNAANAKAMTQAPRTFIPAP